MKKVTISDYGETQLYVDALNHRYLTANNNDISIDTISNSAIDTKLYADAPKHKWWESNDTSIDTNSNINCIKSAEIKVKECSTKINKDLSMLI